MQQIAINTLPYWSRMVIGVDLRFNGTNPYRKVISSGRSIKVFDYRQGENNVSALNGQGSTSRDTILVKANETRGGGLVRIKGISFTRDGSPYETVVNGVDPFNGTDADRDGRSFRLLPGSSATPGNGNFGPQTPTVEDVRGLGVMFNMLFSQFFRVNLNIDGTRRVLEMGPGQLHSGINGPTGDVFSANGTPYSTNYMPIPEGIVWNPAGAVDSNLVVDLEAAYDCYLPQYTSPLGTADGLLPTPTNPPIDNANPTALGRKWNQAWIVNFHGMEESPTSHVS